MSSTDMTATEAGRKAGDGEVQTCEGPEDAFRRQYGRRIPIAGSKGKGE
jgi:hypothetical protein